MASIASEYHRFLVHLAQREVHDDVRRFANLVLENLQTLSEVGAARRARSTRLVPRAIEHLSRMPATCDHEASDPETGAKLGRLHQLQVGPFRGFMQQETFDLSHDITLIYGANGTGKSSFCEALEVAMLGSISEAQAKRVDPHTYCNNARLRRHVLPVLSSTVMDEVRVVQADEGEYRFCFIEKNRLDDFARIAARTPADQRQLIATLFGVDQFSEFVRGFNPSLDQDLMLVGEQAMQLEQRRLQLTRSQEVIAAYPQKIAAIEEQEQALAREIAPGTTYQACVDWLLGTPNTQGRLPCIQTQLDANTPVVQAVTEAHLQALLTEVRRIQGLLHATSTQLADRAGEVSYAKLYEAVLDLADGAVSCPACGTGLAAVAQDPFTKAREGLDQLAQLAALQRQERELNTQLNEAIYAVWSEMRRVIAAAALSCSEEAQGADLPPLPSSATGDWLGAWVDEDDGRAWQSLLQLAKIIEALDERARRLHIERGELAEERDRLQQHQLAIERLRMMRMTVDQDLATAHQTVGEFDEANRDLIQAVEAEVPVLKQHQRIKVAYEGFLPEIQAYMGALPRLLLQGLGERARDLYNAFNRADPPGDLLHALWLPVAENGKIEVEFAREPSVRYDALIVFSEGHIKCLGLAILLAKNIAQGCPVIIFDDVVNAIDDDHRDGIWRTFFEDGLLDGKQIILTSHAEEFLHRIQQELGSRRASDIKRYKFLPHLGQNELRVDSDPPTKNYVLLAQQSLTADEKRQALSQARPALESLTDRLWTWLGRRGDGRIDIKLSGPRSPLELNNKCTKLRSAVSRIASQHDGAPQAVAALDTLLNISGNSIEWGYLNSGVHDSQRDYEFDRAIVRRIVESVAALDLALDSLQNR